ncbi:MAG TPA: thiamine pyrophosphate-binding protein [Candidatus Limnocylindrales bacterium]|nr:thiamine pyrophosphate-binding protein [Candidatus Limnocylindrales bacterium]
MTAPFATRLLAQPVTAEALTAPAVPVIDGPQTVPTATAVALELRALGVQHFFLMTGRDNKLWIALQAAGIRHILTRTESAAVYMADAYARLRGQPTFVYGAYGPGAANVAGSMAEPYWSGSPVVALTSAMRRADRSRNEYQELVQAPLFASVTKWGIEALVPTHVPRLIREAARRAVSGSPGPVYLGIPNDIFEADVPDYREPEPGVRGFEMPLHRPSISSAEAESVVRALSAARRPVILAGGGIHQSNAHEALRRLAERFGIPVATSSAGKGSIAEMHDLALGTVGRYSRNYANATLREADLVLAIGSRLGGLVTDTYKLVSPDAQLIHVSIDPDVVGQNFPTAYGFVADARAFLECVLDASERLETCPSADTVGRLDELAERRAEWRDRRSGLAARDGTDGRPMRPEAVMAAVESAMPDDGVLVADTGYAAAWAGALAEMRTSGRNYLRADGSLGWAYPAAMGAQLAVPQRQVICVTGDGGIGYHIGDIETALRLQLPITVVILDNQTLALEAHVQTLLYGHLVPEVTDFVDVDYGAVARSFGAIGFRATDVNELRQALAVAGERRGPTIIDAVIDRDALGPVTRYDRVRTREL